MVTTQEMINELSSARDNYGYGPIFIKGHSFSNNAFDVPTMCFHAIKALHENASDVMVIPDDNGDAVSMTNDEFLAAFFNKADNIKRSWIAYYNVLAMIPGSYTTLDDIDNAFNTAIAAVPARTSLTNIRETLQSDEATASSLAMTVSGKASTSSVSSLSAQVTADEVTAAALAATVTANGNVTISQLTGLSIVTSTSAGGVQASATKRATVHASVSDSITTAIGGTSTSEIVAEVCATNSTTAGDWVTAGDVGDSNALTLALALQSTQPGKRQLSFEVPAGGWYYRLRSLNGAGTHAEAYVIGQKIVYG